MPLVMVMRTEPRMGLREEELSFVRRGEKVKEDEPDTDAEEHKTAEKRKDAGA